MFKLSQERLIDQIFYAVVEVHGTLKHPCPHCPCPGWRVRQNADRVEELEGMQHILGFAGEVLIAPHHLVPIVLQDDIPWRWIQSTQLWIPPLADTLRETALLLGSQGQELVLRNG